MPYSCQGTNKIKRVCVYCGAKDSTEPVFLHAARRTGELLGRAGVELVYGAGKVSLMGALADAVLSEGGLVTGIIPEFMVKKGWAHNGLTHLVEVKTMSERKDSMIEMSDAFITLPGGWGTLDELFTTLTLNQLGIHRKRSGILNTAGYFNLLLEFMDRGAALGFIGAQERQNLIVESEPERLLTSMGISLPALACI